MLKHLAGGLKAGLRQPLIEINRRRRRVVKPLFLHWAVTWRCNSRCIMCDTWKSEATDPATGREELGPAELDAILTRDAGFLSQVRKLGLTGGEPFVRGDLVELIRVWRRRLPGARVSLVSNGLMPGRILAGLEEIRSFHPELVFSVSLDGVGQVHDKVRGVPGAFDKALATIKGALKLGFTVTSGMTVSSVNHDQISPLSTLLAEMGVDFSCNLPERGANFHSAGPAMELNDQELERVRADLEPFGHHYYMDQVRGSLEGKKRTLPCYSGFTSYFLTPFGDVNVCNLLGSPLGSLRERPFAEIADAPETWRVRRELECCTCWSQCEVKNAAASAPLNVLKWMALSPRRGDILRHYARKAGVLPG